LRNIAQGARNRLQRFGQRQVAAHHFLRVAEAVHRGGIDSVHATLQRMPYGGDRYRIVLRAPAKRQFGPPMAQVPTPRVMFIPVVLNGRVNAGGGALSAILSSLRFVTKPACRNYR
jgi:hypothetical protein